jgi:hypothetical protein
MKVSCKLQTMLSALCDQPQQFINAKILATCVLVLDRQRNYQTTHHCKST